MSVDRGCLFADADAYLREHDVPKDGARADKDEQDQVEEEKYECDDLEGLTVVVIWEQVDEGGHDSRAHDNCVP